MTDLSGGKTHTVTEKMMEAALDAYREGVYLTEWQVHDSVKAIISAAIAESAIGFLRHRIDVLEKAMKLVVAYDDLLLRYEGPIDVPLLAGDVPKIDAAYDEMVVAARIALGAPHPSR